MRVVLALTLWPSLACADPWPIPWDGHWVGADYPHCDVSHRYAGADIISETLCHGLSAEKLATESSWLVHMRCDDEGRVWTSARIVMLEDDRMFVWFGPDGQGAIELLRCEVGGEF